MAISTVVVVVVMMMMMMLMMMMIPVVMGWALRWLPVRGRRKVAHQARRVR